MSGTLIKVSVNQSFTETRWEKSGPPDWQVLHDLVGRYIERVKVRWPAGGKIRDAYVNEDGIALQLSVNQAAPYLLTEAYARQVIVGPLVIWVPDSRE